MASSIQGGVTVSIDGVGENHAEYDEGAFLRSEEKLRAALADYLGTGARIVNLAEVVCSVVAEELG